ncbi:DUF1559 domain-containing protein [Tundrisphaera sp. TA3]|uniref:DUF1559 family PulG-like putative transporter n=1 Tax=Tundrisphaera sp. TA3 TaxID=3435775 RepID=UPI003EB72FA5
MRTGFDHTGPTMGPSRPGARRGLTLVELLVIVAILALLIAFLLPSVRTAGEAARRSQCVNHLKQIGVGVFNYEYAFHCLPPASTADEEGRPLHGWRTLTLAYVEQDTVYQTINLARSWDDATNTTASGIAVPIYHCPSSPAPAATTTYLGIATPDGCFPPGRLRTMEEITDGTGSTLMVIEAGEEHAAPWPAPVDAGERLILGLGSDAKLRHPGGSNALFADGSVRFLKATVPTEVRRAWISVAGGEKIPDDQY